MYSSALCLIWTLDGVGGQHHAPASISREGIPVSILFVGLWPKSATEVLATSPCWRGPRCVSQLVLIAQ
jgi:hypothetical protein